MEERNLEALPPIGIFSIGPQEADRVSSLLTAEAMELLLSRQAFGLAAVEEGEARGAVCVRLNPENETCLELVSLYVAPQYRRRGLGGTLLLELLDACGEEFEGSLARVETAFSMEPGLMALLEKAGFQLEREGEDACSCTVPVSKLEGSPLMKHGTALPKDHMLLPLEKLSRVQIRQLAQTLERAGVDYIGPQRLADALPQASFVLLDAKREFTACAILTGQEEGRLCLSQFFTAGGSAAKGMAVLRAAAGALLEQSPGAQLEIPLLARSSAKLMEHLLGEVGEREPLVRAVLVL